MISDACDDSHDESLEPGRDYDPSTTDLSHLRVRVRVRVRVTMIPAPQI